MIDKTRYAKQRHRSGANIMHIKITTGDAYDKGCIGGIGEQQGNASEVEPFAVGTAAKESQ